MSRRGEALVVDVNTSDMRVALTLVYDAGTDTGGDALPRAFLAGLAQLIPADVIVGYSEVEVRRPWRVWLPAPAGRARAVYLERSALDFSERDRSLLQLLRPSLTRILDRSDARRAHKRAHLLTSRERQILRAIASGQTTPQIAAQLVVSPHTVRKHVEHILQKLGAHTRSEAVAVAATQLASGPSH